MELVGTIIPPWVATLQLCRCRQRRRGEESRLVQRWCRGNSESLLQTVQRHPAQRGADSRDSLPAIHPKVRRDLQKCSNRRVSALSLTTMDALRDATLCGTMLCRFARGSWRDRGGPGRVDEPCGAEDPLTVQELAQPPIHHRRLENTSAALSCAYGREQDGFGALDQH